ncbi:MAG: segregation/condensation protein A [Planctomycetes bacterium]|nr:segregation/condensation protein A [Planctomycetota bacterium]
MVVDVLVEDRFKGPMDLLLYLIKRDEVDIHDIPISHVTGEYLKALAEMQTVDVEVGAEFINMATILMEIKSRMLLPPEELADDEETIEIDPRADLVQALLEYKRFKEAADGLGDLLETHQDRFPRIGKITELEDDPREEMIDAELDQLYFAFLKLMDEISLEGADIIESTEISTEEVIGVIIGQLSGSKRVLFSKVFKQATTRYELVVYFIAMLELIRMRRVLAFQKDDFGEIYLEKAPEVIRSIAAETPEPGQNLNPGQGGLVLRLPGFPSAEAALTMKQPVPQFLPLIFRCQEDTSAAGKVGNGTTFLALQKPHRNATNYTPQDLPFL